MSLRWREFSYRLEYGASTFRWPKSFRRTRNLARLVPVVSAEADTTADDINPALPIIRNIP